MSKNLLTALALAAALLAAAARAEDTPTVWSGLVLATNEDNPLPQELEPYKAKLEHIFGYTHFVLIGQHSEVMDEPSEHWLVPSRKFCLQAKSSHSPQGPGYLVQLQLFREEHLLVTTKVWLAPHNPLFIRGPVHGRGQLIIILLVK